MFINKTLFDRFAEATGAEIEQLNTWEGVFELSTDYYQWTDKQTPEVEGDGKTFFVHDYHFNYFQVGIESMGEPFFKEGELAYGEKFEKAWEIYAKAAIQGGVWLNEGYATEPLRTGNAVVSVASSASVLYYEDIVTYADNRSENIEVIARPVPYFENGTKMVMQRGAGFCTVKSTPQKEQAAAEFLKWLTAPENNVHFVTQVGYMPVTEKAFDILPEALKKLDDSKYKSLYEAFIETQNSYEFYTPPQLDNYLKLETSFEENVRSSLRQANKSWQEERKDTGMLIAEALEHLKEDMGK